MEARSASFKGAISATVVATAVGDVRFARSAGIDRAHDVLERGFLLR